jgi:hypothetical protein
MKFLRPREEADAGRNSRREIEKRVARGQIAWTGPLMLVVARTFLLIVMQTLLAGIYAARHNPSPWQAAAPWCFVGGSVLSSLLVYRSFGPHIPPGQLHERALPLWAAVEKLAANADILAAAGAQFSLYFLAAQWSPMPPKI